MSIGLALAEEMTSETKGLRFDSNLTVEGFGIASSYRYMAPSELVLHSHSSGSGVFTSESKTYARNDQILNQDEGMTVSLTSNVSAGVQEITSNAYSPTKLDFPGSFRSEPISSLWSDSTFAGSDGVALKASFDHAQALNKEMTTKVSGGGTYDQEGETKSSASFAGSMKLNAVFNGTGQIGAYLGPLNGKDPEALMDEFYRGTFTISKKMVIGIKSSLTQNEDEWLPCCSGGWNNMNYKDKESFPVDANRVFNCTCFSIPI
ncbi:MAG: hypothetical protein WAW52_01035 [Methanothrix sp.]